MSTNDTFLAIFLGSKTSPRMAAWNSLSEEVRRTKMQEGIAAWKAWAEKASCRNRRDGGSPRQDQEGERARH